VPQKTRHRQPEQLVIPCLPALKAELDEWRKGALTGIGNATILANARGKPWHPNNVSHQLPEALARIGLTNELNVHGLRKLAARNLAEAGCSSKLIAAITGHASLQMIELYTRSADQKTMAEAAIIRLADHLGQKP
jgi:integrase